VYGGFRVRVMMAMAAVVFGGAAVIAGYWALEQYFRERRRQRMLLDPSVRSYNIPKKNNDDDVKDWSVYNASMWQQLSPEDKIQQVRTKLQMDTENTANIAVCGNSGTGKSTFINCVRGLPDVEMNDNFVYKEDGSAPVGIMETTRKTMPYRWPQNQMPHLTLWDLPAVGKMSNPDRRYFEEIGLYAFDCILLLRAGRFTEFDVAICQQALKYKIPIVLVLSKGDQDVSSSQKIKIHNLGRKLTEDEFQQLIPQTISTLKTNGLAELMSIPGGNKYNLNKIPMFVVAAQSYRDRLNHQLDPQDCPPLETHKLLEYCLTLVTDHLQKTTDEYKKMDEIP